VSGHTAHGIGIIVMDFAAEHPPAPRTSFRRGNITARDSTLSLRLVRQIDERHRLQPERAKDSVSTKPIEIRPTHLLDQSPEEHEPEIAVEDSFPGRGFARFALH